MSNRRTFLGRALGVGTALFAARGLSAQVMQMQMPCPPGTPRRARPRFHRKAARFLHRLANSR